MNQIAPILNIAAYLFVDIDHPAETVVQIRALCAALALKGTVLVAPEGINLFLAGTTPRIDEFLSTLRRDPRFAALVEKRQHSEAQPFKRMKVKLKREIVPLGANNLPVHLLSVAQNPAPRICAETLKAWIDAGKNFVLLDTRNRFEFERGTFAGAVDLNIGQFRNFPDAVQAKLGEWQDLAIVTFCTGGIRCEKAAPLMQRLGFRDVHQLDGGILKYFERCGAAHFQGDCFVFDERTALDGALTPTTATSP
jgi:UPF0176 protein